MVGNGSSAVLRDKDLYLSGSLGHFGVALVSLNVPARAPLVRMLSGQDIALSRIQRSIIRGRGIRLARPKFPRAGPWGEAAASVCRVWPAENKVD